MRRGISDSPNFSSVLDEVSISELLDQNLPHMDLISTARADRGRWYLFRGPVNCHDRTSRRPSGCCGDQHLYHEFCKEQMRVALASRLSVVHEIQLPAHPPARMPRMSPHGFVPWLWTRARPMKRVKARIRVRIHCCQTGCRDRWSAVQVRTLLRARKRETGAWCSVQDSTYYGAILTALHPTLLSNPLIRMVSRIQSPQKPQHNFDVDLVNRSVRVQHSYIVVFPVPGKTR
jgi:hypothetical protein